MATLKIFEVADPNCGGSNISLREWLDGRWAVLFSHPDDFVQCDLEFDRWLGLVDEAFARARIRPLALPRASYRIDHGWIRSSRAADRYRFMIDCTAGIRSTSMLVGCRMRSPVCGGGLR